MRDCIKNTVHPFVSSWFSCTIHCPTQLIANHAMNATFTYANISLTTPIIRD
jgi:hypothetical protein